MAARTDKNLPKDTPAADRIPAEVYILIGEINRRYRTLNLSGGQFEGLSDRERLHLLITLINEDQEIANLHALSMIGSIIVFRQIRDFGSTGWGCNLCIGNNGLYIYDWNDYEGKHNNIPASPNALENLKISLGCEELREAIVTYTDRKNYVTCVEDFGEFL